MLDKKMKKVIISGATSMIGVALIEECIKNNIYVTALSRKNSPNLIRLPKSKFIDIVECDINNLENLKNLCSKDYDIFYHFAWEGTTKSERNDIFLQDKNITTSITALKMAKELGCHTFVGAGSQAEFGRVDKDKISPETSANPEIAYGIAKYSACKLTQIYAKQLGINHIWGRIFSVYGIWDNEGTMINSTIDKLLKKEKTSFTKAEQIWDYLYSEDAGRAFYLMGLKGKDQSIYCIGSGEGKPLYEYIKIISEKLSNKLELGIGEIGYTENQVMRLCADISSLKEDTGFTPKYNFEEGIAKTLEWKKIYFKSVKENE
ncbi:NAD-dependent epimerase/dehydratase family protein [Cetobacterium somerae]|uniref:NAD-dependent epimerase/dehydratase family protein n=1 Tax=Cetobacterium somerae TaxID=188913 RepID=UPI003D768A47